MKVRMENHAVVTADIFFLRNCVVNNFVYLRGSVENVQESIDDFLIVSNVLFWFDVSGGFIDDFVDGCGQVGKDLS